VVEKLNKELVRIMALPAVHERLARDEITSEPLSADQFAKLVADETAKWGPIAKASGAQPE
ncbi:MAG TPA: tripartite tricarboxylate transporter substrate binding protein, partial [Beijerinckiaceae bacterium]|nr:tripartite tricarboxylate transporter substrate binding protein [Beijerinckiaceae bacterium]